DFVVFSGDDSTALALIALGARGLISVASNEIPRDMTALIRAALEGRSDDARKLQRKYLSLMEMNFWESSPAPAKCALFLMKKCGRWVVRRWVKQGILLGFQVGTLSRAVAETGFRFFDRDTFPLKDLRLESQVRIVPGGTAIRDGCYIAPGVTLMPPAYVNVG